MAKVALLIGVSEYGPGLNQLPGAVKAVEAMQQVLQPPGMGGFDKVKPLLNPNPPAMREAIETLFSGRTNNDLVLLFFSGHIFRDDSNEFYLATSIACKNPRAELLRVSTVPVGFLHELMSSSPCQNQVVILDCCLSSLSDREITVSEDGTADLKTLLASEGRAILTSFTFSQNSLALENLEPSVYTHYLVEGIRTGSADLNSDGWISVDEWHQYANSNVQIAAPAMKPEFYSVENGRKILLAKALIDDPKLKYRKEVENWIRRGEIAEAGHYVLEKLAESLLLTFEERAAIEAEALHPYQEYQEKLQRYEREFANVFRQNSPLGAPEREELKNLQQSLGLRDGDVAPLEELIAWKLTSISQSEEEVNEVAQWDIKSETNSLPSTLGTVLPDYAQIPAPVPINPTPAVNLSSSLAGSKVSPRSSSTSPKKSFLLIGGIGGSLAAMAVVIGMSSRAPIEPPPEDTVSSSPNPSPHPFPTVTSADKETSPSPIAPPETKECLVFVNGNLRSKPASFQADNVVATLREALPVTGKQTEGGWVEVKLSERKLAWVHRQIIANDEQMDACLSKKGIKIRKVEDIPPPPPSPNRSSEYRNSGVQNSL